MAVPAPRRGGDGGGGNGGGLVLQGFDPWADDQQESAALAATAVAPVTGGETRTVLPGEESARTRRPQRRARSGSRRANPAERPVADSAVRGWTVGPLVIKARDLTGSVSAVMGALLFVSGLVLGAAPLVFSGAMLVYVAATVLGPQV